MNKKKLIFIELPSSQGSEFINPEDIIAIRANDKSICMSVENQKDKSIRLSIGRAEKLLPQAYFVKCHRSHIINVLKIKGLLKKQSKIILTNGQEIPISATYKKQFNDMLKNFCAKMGGVNC